MEEEELIKVKGNGHVMPYIGMWQVGGWTVQK